MVERLQPAAAPAGPYQIAYAIDGDAIAVTTDPGADRSGCGLIGLSSPEVTQTAECFGSEAPSRTTELPAAGSVWQEPTPSQGAVDRYGCTLAFVWTGPEGRALVDAELIAEGVAHKYTYDRPTAISSSSRPREQLRGAGLLGVTYRDMPVDKLHLVSVTLRNSVRATFPPRCSTGVDQSQ